MSTHRRGFIAGTLGAVAAAIVPWRWSLDASAFTGRTERTFEAIFPRDRITVQFIRDAVAMLSCREKGWLLVEAASWEHFDKRGRSYVRCVSRIVWKPDESLGELRQFADKFYPPADIFGWLASNGFREVA